jgi:hypothetical protein
MLIEFIQASKSQTILFFQACPLCMGKFSGRNIAVESVAALLFAKCGLGGNLQTQEQESRSFTFLNNLESGLEETVDNEQTKKSSGASGPDDILVDTEGETLRM